MTHTKIKSKWIKDLISETIKLLEENTGSMLFDNQSPKKIFFLDISPQAKETKAKINKWNYIKLKSFAQETINKVKTSPIE